MPFVRVWIHFVWSTKNHQPQLTKELRPLLFKHIKENARKKRIHLDSINGHLDHVHALVGLKADQSISRIAQLLKGESSHWVNDQKLTPIKFEWQDEYFAVSVSESAVEEVRRYILNQEEHHRKKTFGEEYREFLQKYGFRDEG